MDVEAQFPRVVATVVAAVVPVLAACGGSSPSSSKDEAARSGSKAPAQRIAARLDEYAIGLDRDSAPSGRITFDIRNDGRRVHEFVVLRSDDAQDALPSEGNEVNEHAVGNLVDEAEDIRPRTTVTLGVGLKPGKYVLICNLPGHYARGMHAAFRVTWRRPPGAAADAPRSPARGVAAARRRLARARVELPYGPPARWRRSVPQRGSRARTRTDAWASAPRGAGFGVGRGAARGACAVPVPG